jgi:phosphoglycolate phosphatase
MPTACWPDADRIWRAYYAKHHPKLMSGARRVIGQLARRHKLGLVTSGDRNRVMGQLREFGLLRVLRTRVCGGDLEEKKPHPAPLQMALRQMAIEPAECVYVGDTPEDVEMARAAGVRAIAVLGPFPTEKRLRAVRPEFLLDNLQKLPELLRELYGEARRPRTRS